MDPIEADRKRMTENATRADGERLLAQVAKMKEEKDAPSIIGPDGQPMAKPEPEAPGMAAGDIRTHMGLLHEQMERRRIKSARGFSELLTKYENLAKVYDVFYSAWELIWWCRMEMSTNPDISDEMIEDLDHIVQAKLYNNKGYNLKEAYAHMRTKALPIVNDYIQQYSQAAKVRKVRFDSIKKRTGGKWLQLPFDIPKSERENKPSELKPGQVLVLQGTAEANRAALTATAIATVAQKERFVYFGEVNPSDTSGFEKHACTFVPKAWWGDIASNNAKLLDGLDATVKETHLALFVEDLGALFVSDTEKLNENQRKGFALKRLFAWAVDNLVSVVVCDNVETHTTERGVYGFIPYLRTSLDKGVLKVEGRPVLGWQKPSSSLDGPSDSPADGKS
jgi:hypothetical protein